MIITQFLSVDSVQCSAKVEQCCVQFFVLLFTRLLELFEDKHHICSAPFGSDATLTFREIVLSDGVYQSAQRYSCNVEVGCREQERPQ